MGLLSTMKILGLKFKDDKPRYCTGWCVTGDHEHCPHNKGPVKWGDRTLPNVTCFCWCHDKGEDDASKQCGDSADKG